MENIVEKGEIAHFEQFHLFPQCFPKAFFFNVFKVPKAPNYKGVCLQNTSKFHSYHLKIWHLL